MPTEDFTTFTEVDPGSTITVTSGTITWANLDTRNSSSYVYKDYGAAYFDGDFTHRFKINFASGSGSTPYAAVWGMANAVNDFYSIEGASGDYIAVLAVTQSTLQLRLCEDGSVSLSNLGLGIGVDYYVTVIRDDVGGANGTGQITMHVCVNNYYGESGYTLSGTRTLDCGVGEQNDFQYLYATSTFNTGDSSRLLSLTIDDLDISGLPSSVTAEGTTTLDLTAIGTALVIETIEAAGTTTLTISSTAAAVANILGRSSTVTLIAIGNDSLYYES